MKESNLDKAVLKWTRNKWELTDDLTVKVKKKEITIPKGFRTDLASVPKVLWMFIPPFGKHNEAAVVHDYLYKNQTYPQVECDKIFLDILREYRVSYFTRSILYLGVKYFGKCTYKNYANRTRKRNNNKLAEKL